MHCKCNHSKDLKILDFKDRQNEISCRLLQKDIENINLLEEYKATINIKNKSFKMIILAENDHKAKQILLDFLRNQQF